jgi:hypothetical protein
MAHGRITATQAFCSPRWSTPRLKAPVIAPDHDVGLFLNDVFWTNQTLQEQFLLIRMPFAAAFQSDCTHDNTERTDLNAARQLASHRRHYRALLDSFKVFGGWGSCVDVWDEC